MPRTRRTRRTLARRVTRHPPRRTCAAPLSYRPSRAHGADAALQVDGGGKILFDEFAKWGILKALDLEEDDNFDDGGETAKHEAVGYIAEKGAGKSGFIERPGGGAQPKLCYATIGASVPVQMTARFESAKSPFSPHSPSRAKASPVFRSKEHGSLPIIGGMPFRKLQAGDKMMPNMKISPLGTISGLPYALSQLLLEKSKEDREAQAASLADKTLTAEDRAYGAETLELPKKGKDAPKALESKSGGGSKSSAKVAPA